MRISDWSSDVCSSDLVAAERGEGGVLVVVAGFVDERLAGTGAKVEAGFFGRLRAEGGGADQGGKQGSGQHLVLAHCFGLLQRPSHEGGGRRFPRDGPRRGAWAAVAARKRWARERDRSEETTSELQSLMRISYAVFCLKKKNKETR